MQRIYKIFDEMKILISNDDGYQAPGIHALARVMSGFGEVTVVAPKYHQSAMSMAVDLGFKKLAFKELGRRTGKLREIRPRIHVPEPGP